MPSPSRLFVEERLESGSRVTLAEEPSHYVSRVLRLRAGDALTLFDGRGGEFAATVEEISKKAVVVRAGDRFARECESPLAIRLVQAVSRGERMDFVVQKVTELGVARITPVLTAFSVVRLDAKKRASRAAHWTRVAQSACEQCGRNRVPVVDAPRSYDEWLNEPAEPNRLRLLLEPGAALTLASIDAAPAGVELLVGPEGGLSDSEREQARAQGFVAVSVGPRVLRTETAAVAAVAVLQYRWGDIA